MEQVVEINDYEKLLFLCAGLINALLTDPERKEAKTRLLLREYLKKANQNVKQD
jgi:hypothetical protein